jgi:ABC-type phosphate transport system substrate-binding protein
VRNRSRRLAVLASIAALGTIVGLAAPAGAGPTVLTGAKHSVAAAGSDTSYWMMNLISPSYNVNTTKNLDGDYVTQIPPVNTAPFPAGTFVPADAVAASALWDSSVAGQPPTPPDGSSAGITALNNDTLGNIDFARSSRGPNAGETPALRFWAYALGAADYVTFPGTHAPAAGLTQQQLINIYTCSPSTHLPIISNWSQVGGTAGVIKKYQPQAGSGTRSFVVSKLLNGNDIDANCDASHKSVELQEHDARGVTAVSKPNAIYVFDWGRYRAQGTGIEANLRNGATLGKLGTTTANRQAPSATTVNATASRFLGTRYIFNVVRAAAHPAGYATQLADVEKLIGVRPAASGGAGYICSGLAATQITLAGFVPLPSGATGGTGLPVSTCRLNPAAL